MPAKLPRLVGNWEKITESPCSRVYPTRLEFRPGGLYSGAGAEPGDAPGWDRGTWRLLSPNRVQVSTINDAIITYEVSIADNVLTFVDPGGGEFQYERVR